MPDSIAAAVMALLKNLSAEEALALRGQMDHDDEWRSPNSKLYDFLTEKANA